MNPQQSEAKKEEAPEAAEPAADTESLRLWLRNL